MQSLIQDVFLKAFSNSYLSQLHDSAVVPIEGHRIAVTTDSYVVRPLFFPGGDIGSMAVHGTINDLAMSGATPLYLTAGFILEEGLPIETLQRIVTSMADAARKAGVSIVCGDTKVVDRGKGDQIFINTTGVGRLAAEGLGREVAAVVVPIGRHDVLEAGQGQVALAVHGGHAA